MAERGFYKWTAAFVAYCNGTPIEEIALVFSIPLDTLKDKIRVDSWNALRSKMALAVVNQDNAGSLLPAEVKAKFNLIQENRQKNLDGFVRLRQRFLDQLEQWEQGELKIRKVFNGKDGIRTYDADPGPGDWVNIATFLTQVAQGTYKALGDMAAQDKPGSDALAGQAQLPNMPAITIVLPGVVAYPRHEREIKVAQAGTVIDVDAQREKPDQQKPQS